MANINIESTQEDRNAVLTAVGTLNDNKVVKHMSYAMLASESGLSPEKVRLVIGDLVNEGLLKRFDVSRSKRVPRYYYVRSDK